MTRSTRAAVRPHPGPADGRAEAGPAGPEHGEQAPPAAGLSFDGTGLLCVTLLLRLRAIVADVAPGTVVHVVATDPAAPLDLPAWCHMTGHEYLGPVTVGGATPVYAQRLAPAPRPPGHPPAGRCNRIV